MDKEKLFNENRGLIKFCMKKLHAYYETEDEYKEIESIAYLGMTKGINTYDPTMDIKVSTYLVKCISNEINHYYTNKTRQKRINDFGKDISLSSYLTDEEDDTFEETIASDVNVEETVINEMYTKDLVERAVKVLKPKYKEIIIKYFGLYGEERMTLERLGKTYKMSKVSVGQYIQRALTRMRKEIQKCS